MKSNDPMRFLVSFYTFWKTSGWRVGCRDRQGFGTSYTGILGCYEIDLLISCSFVYVLSSVDSRARDLIQLLPMVEHMEVLHSTLWILCGRFSCRMLWIVGHLCKFSFCTFAKLLRQTQASSPTSTHTFTQDICEQKPLSLTHVL